MKLKKPVVVEGSAVLAAKAAELAALAPSGLAEYYRDVLSARETNAEQVLAASDAQPLSRPVDLAPGDLADPYALNRFFDRAYTDLRGISAGTSSMAEAMQASYNLVGNRSSALRSKLEQIGERLAALSLYGQSTSQRNVFALADFSSRNGLASGEYTLSEFDDVLMLPVDSRLDHNLSGAQFELLPSSTGGPVDGHANLLLMQDESQHTWFQMDTRSEGHRGYARLGFRVSFPGPLEINQIRFNFVNLGHVEAPLVASIDFYEEGVLRKTLSELPRSRLFDFTFDPVVCTQVVVNVQQEGFRRLSGSAYLQSIGIQSLSLSRVKFQTAGSFELEPLTFPRPVAAVAVSVGGQPDPQLYDFLLSASTDQGRTWQDIEPIEGNDPSRHELLHLEKPTSDILVKGHLVRNDETVANAATSEFTN